MHKKLTYVFWNFLFAHCYIELDKRSLHRHHFVAIAFSQFLKGADFGFLVIGRQIGDDARVIGVDNDNCDDAPDKNEDSHGKIESPVTISC